MTKRKALVVGVHTAVGQGLLAALADHPWFELAGVVAETQLDPSRVSSHRFDHPFVAVGDDAAAADIEIKLARDIPVISTAAAHRYKEDVPLLLPPVNPHHSRMFVDQKRITGFTGILAPLPGATAAALAQTLAPLDEHFGVQAVAVTALQAMPTVLDNVIPCGPREEARLAKETRKILGSLRTDSVGFLAHGARMSCTSTCVPVSHGTTLSVIVSLRRPATIDDAAQAFRTWRGADSARGLPSSPARWLDVVDAADRPQPRLDAAAGGGLVATVGRLRDDTVLDNALRYVAVANPHQLGGARGAVLVAELLREQNFA